MNRFLLLFLSFELWSLSFAAAFPSRIQVTLNPAVELAGVVQLLGSDAHKYDGFAAPADLDYVKDARKRFAKFKDDPAVKSMADMDGGGFDFVSRGQYLVRLSTPPELDPKRAIANDFLLARTKGQGGLDRWRQALGDFAGKSDFMTFYGEQARALSVPLEGFKTLLEKRDYMGLLEAYTGLPYNGTYTIVLSPMLLPVSGVNGVFLDDDGSDAIFSLVGPSGAQKGLPDFTGMDDLPSTAWHEMSHGQLDALALVYGDDIARRRSLYRALKFPCYGEWNQCFEEHLVRAVKNRLIAREVGEKEAAEDMAAEESKGFLYLRALTAKLRAYEADRKKYPTIVTFYPGLLAALPAGAPEDKDAAAPVSISTPGQRWRAIQRLDAIIATDPQPRFVKMRETLKSLSGSGDTAAAAIAMADDQTLRQPEGAAPPKDAAEQAYERGLLRFSKGEKAAALADFETALKGHPGQAHILLSRSVALQSLGKSDAALESYGLTLAATQESDGLLRAEVLSSRASLLQSMGEKARAREDLALALKTAPPDWERRKESRDALALLPAPAAPPAPPKFSGPRIEVVMDPALELVAVLQQLGAKGHDYHRFVIHEELPFVRAVPTRFAAFKDDPAVRLTAELDAGGFDYDTRAQVLLQLSATPALEPVTPINDWMTAKAGGAKKLEAWLSALRAFARRSDFAAFYEEEVRACAPATRALQARVSEKDFTALLEKYSGLPFEGRYTLVTSPYYRPTVGVSVTLQEPGGTRIVSVAGPVEIKDGLPDYHWIDAFPGGVWRELTDVQLDVLAALYRDRIAASSPLLKRLDIPCYQDWGECVKDHIARAVKVRMLAVNLGEDEGTRDMQDDMKHGFTFVRPLADALKEYEGSRGKYPSLAAFYPNLLSALEGLMTPGERRDVRLLKSSPDRIASYAVGLMDEEARRRAIAFLDAMILKDPEALKWRRFRGMLEELNGDSAAALDDASAVVARIPIDLDSQLLKGVALNSLGRREEAASVFAYLAAQCRLLAAQQPACSDNRSRLSVKEAKR